MIREFNVVQNMPMDSRHYNYSFVIRVLIRKTIRLVLEEETGYFECLMG